MAKTEPRVTMIEIGQAYPCQFLDGESVTVEQVSGVMFRGKSQTGTDVIGFAWQLCKAA